MAQAQEPAVTPERLKARLRAAVEGAASLVESRGAPPSTPAERQTMRDIEQMAAVVMQRIDALQNTRLTRFDPASAAAHILRLEGVRRKIARDSIDLAELSESVQGLASALEAGGGGGRQTWP